MAGGTGAGALWQVMPALTVLVALLLGLRWFVRRQHGIRRPGLRVVSRASVSKNTVVAVVEVDDQRYLVGGGDQRLELLAELAAAPEPVAESAEASTDAPRPRTATPTAVRALLDGAPSPTLPGGERSHEGPWTGLVDQLRARTVRSRFERPVRVSQEV